MYTLQNSYYFCRMDMGKVRWTYCSLRAILLSLSTWGESLFIAIQVIILLGLLFYYNDHMMYTGIFVPVYGTAVWYLTSGLASMELLSTLQASVIILMLASRVRLWRPIATSMLSNNLVYVKICRGIQLLQMHLPLFCVPFFFLLSTYLSIYLSTWLWNMI